LARDLYATLDLNLLKTLLVHSQEQNIRPAADRLFVTQPAVSQALKKLRYHFGEELFIRTATGLQPTNFTERLVNRLTPVLDELSSILNNQETFDASQLAGSLSIALSPHLNSYLSGRLFRTLRELAPGVRLRLTSWNEESLADLLKDELHLGVNLEIEQTPKQVMTQYLAEDHFMLYVREDHPLTRLKRALTPGDFDGCEIANLIIPDWNTRVSNMESILKASGYRTRSGFRSDVPGAITDAVRCSDLVYPASSYIDSSLLHGLRRLEVNVESEIMRYPINAHYHQKHRRNPLTLWLVERIEQLLA
jgi:DNA-binding transcriptional LysR family regulator